MGSGQRQPGCTSCVPGRQPERVLASLESMGGILYRIELVGLELGPIVVSASVQDRALAVLCPVCQQRFQIDNSSLGSEITCPNEGCHTRLKENSSNIQRPAHTKGNWLSSLLKK